MSYLSLRDSYQKLLFISLLLTGCASKNLGPFIGDSTYAPYRLQICTNRPNLAELEHFAKDNGCRAPQVPMDDPYILEPSNCATFSCDPNAPDLDKIFKRRSENVK